MRSSSASRRRRSPCAGAGADCGTAFGRWSAASPRPRARAAAALPHVVTASGVGSFSAAMAWAAHSPSGTRRSVVTTSATVNFAPRATGLSASALTACASTSRSVSSSASAGMSPSMPVISRVIADGAVVVEHHRQCARRARLRRESRRPIDGPSRARRAPRWPARRSSRRRRWPVPRRARRRFAIRGRRSCGSSLRRRRSSTAIR